jgi:hypothetical protein
VFVPSFWDGLTFDVARMARERGGLDDVNYQSNAYSVGYVAGMVAQEVLLTAGELAITAGSGGAAGNAFDQGLNYVASGKSFEWGSLISAAALGAVTGFASAKGMIANMQKVCFTGDTKLIARNTWGVGYRRIDEIAVGDEVLSRDEYNVNGELAWKRVEERFVRTGRIWHLHVGGELIRTTGEHPFYVHDKGWVPASELQPGDVLSSHDGQWIVVEEVYDTGEYETVYNLRVADWHTYFVGDDTWGFSLWAHNQCIEEARRVGTKDVLADVAGKFRAEMKRNGQSKVSQGKNVAVVEIDRGNGTEYLVTVSGRKRAYVATVGPDGKLRITETVKVSKSHWAAIGSSRPHSEEIAMSILDRMNQNMIRDRGSRLLVSGFFSEYGPCGALPGSHSCSDAVRRWSQAHDSNRETGIRFRDGTEFTFRFYYPDSAKDRRFHRNFKLRDGYAANQGTAASEARRATIGDEYDRSPTIGRLDLNQQW